MLDIELARSRAAFEEARELISLMAAWDITESQALGIGDRDVLAAYYSDTPDMMVEKFTTPGAGLFLCRLDGMTAGCAAFSAVDEHTAELHKMFVKPGHRGKGVGKALLTASLAEMKRNAYAQVRLETVQFMREAISLYKSFGFVSAQAFHDRPESFRQVTIFMQRDL